MTVFKHSGCLGDVIYSLPVIQKMGGGELHLVHGGVPAAIKKYNNGPVPDDYKTKLSDNEINLLLPLLMAQPYITGVEIVEVDAPCDVDLDEFRGTVGQSFTGNFLATYFKAFNLPYTDADIITPWLTVELKRVAKNVICRTMRYRSTDVSTIPTWCRLLRHQRYMDDAVFIGLKDEHDDFQTTFNVQIPRYEITDFHDMARVIAGCDTFLGNQTFAYGIAQGLGKSTILETLKWRTLENNECFFPRPNCYYF